jgi:hypothetical protein
MALRNDSVGNVAWGESGLSVKALLRYGSSSRFECGYYVWSDLDKFCQETTSEPSTIVRNQVTSRFRSNIHFD